MTVVSETPPSLVRDDEKGRVRLPALLLTSAELAECNCPDACERDHDRD